MRAVRTFAPVCALFLCLILASQIQAGWNNVFQLCCDSHPGVSAESCYEPCCPPPPCENQCVQRCRYEPVVSMQTTSHYELVTTYRTSYYYEPVTTYSYSCYCDPCSGCTPVASPTTTYVQRSQSCPEQKWVERTSQVPVTSYKLVCPCESAPTAPPTATLQTPSAQAPSNPRPTVPGGATPGGGDQSGTQPGNTVPNKDIVPPPPTRVQPIPDAELRSNRRNGDQDRASPSITLIPSGRRLEGTPAVARPSLPDPSKQATAPPAVRLLGIQAVGQ